MPTRTGFGEDRSEDLATPPPLNKHQQKTELTKRKLLRAALDVFSRDGFEASRIDDIASEAGYTRGAFYAHFASKEDLFFSLLEEESRLHLNALKKAMQACRTDRERFTTLRDYYVSRRGDQRWTILSLEFKLYAVRHPKLRAKLAAAYRRVKDKIKWHDKSELWTSASAFRSEDRELVRMVLQLLLNGLVLEQAYDPSSISDSQVKSLLERIFDMLISRKRLLRSGGSAREDRSRA